MNTSDQDPISDGRFDETLRLIANLPAPDNLEDRVHAALRSAPRKTQILSWPAALRPDSNWMRATAAAAIVFVVAGGGWRIYSLVQVQQGQPAKVIVMPARGPAASGFSGAGAMRTPQSLNGPVVARPVTALPSGAKPTKKAKARTEQSAGHPAQPAALSPAAGVQRMSRSAK